MDRPCSLDIGILRGAGCYPIRVIALYGVRNVATASRIMSAIRLKSASVAFFHLTFVSGLPEAPSYGYRSELAREPGRIARRCGSCPRSRLDCTMCLA